MADILKSGSKCIHCNIYDKQVGSNFCVKCDGLFNTPSPPENSKQLIQAFHLLVACNFNLTIQHYKPSHPMYNVYFKTYQAVMHMELYLKEHYPDEFAESFGEKEG